MPDNNNNSLILSQLLILGEDRRFYKHIGFDMVGILRAILNNITNNSIEGASTIEQQLVRVLLQDYRRIYSRKIKEIFLSTVIANYIPKKMIPYFYLKVAHFGTELEGIDSIIYRLGIGKNEDISLEIAAEIIARIKYPEPKRMNLSQNDKITYRKKHLIILYETKNGNIH